MIDMNKFGKKERLKAVKMTNKQAESLYAKADAAGKAAVAKLYVQPMVVGTAKSLFSNEIDYSKPVEVVADGPCGFASVQIRPSKGGFASWARDKGIAKYSDYEKCAYIWISGYNQSMMKKECYAAAFADVLCEAGIAANAWSRMD